MGDIFTGLCILNSEFLTFLDHDSEIVQRHIRASSRIVEPAIGIFFNDDLAIILCHV